MKKELQSFDNNKILIVGGLGFIGTNLTKMLLGNNRRLSITVVDNLLSSELINLSNDDRITFIKGSISDNNILRLIQDEYNYIFHLATYHGNQSSIANPLVDHQNNTLTTLKLYEKVKSFKLLKKVVYAASGCSIAKKTFDSAVATQEDDPVDIKQDSPYSISKIIGEFYSVYYHDQYGLPAVRARFQNVYGPFEILGAGRWRGTPATVWRNVIPTFIYKALKGRPLPLENEGKASRDFIYVEDICRGLIACALKGKDGDVYNIASGNETTILELATLINKLTDNKEGFELLPKRTWDNSGKRFGSVVKSREGLNFSANVLLEKGLQQTIKWTSENLDTIDKVIAKHKNKMKRVVFL
jgi:UDP-glucose 4-epimerase